MLVDETQRHTLLWIVKDVTLAHESSPEGCARKTATLRCIEHHTCLARMAWELSHHTACPRERAVCVDGAQLKQQRFSTCHCRRLRRLEPVELRDIINAHRLQSEHGLRELQPPHLRLVVIGARSVITRCPQ